MLILIFYDLLSKCDYKSLRLFAKHLIYYQSFFLLIFLSLQKINIDWQVECYERAVEVHTILIETRNNSDVRFLKYFFCWRKRNTRKGNNNAALITVGRQTIRDDTVARARRTTNVLFDYFIVRLDKKDFLNIIV